MKLVLISILAAITALTTATPVTEVEPLPFEEGPMQWTGEVIDGEGLITLEGSLPEIMDQIKTINPQYFDTDHSNEVVSDDGLTKRQVGGCEPRGIDVDIMCDVPYGTVHGKDLRAGLSYLGPMSWRSGGCMTQRANRCGRISCSYNTAIFVCADVSWPEPRKLWRSADLR